MTLVMMMTMAAEWMMVLRVLMGDDAAARADGQSCSGLLFKAKGLLEWLPNNCLEQALPKAACLSKKSPGS